jgi:DNA-binding transcriptional LysR family regulator
MDITLDQARAMVNVAKLGTVKKAALALNKGHSAVLYLLKGLEAQVGVELFDRSGYRNKLSDQGRVVLGYCERLLEVTQELETACQKFQLGWEASLTLIYDGVVDFQLISQALSKIGINDIPTQVNVKATYLDDVQSAFDKGQVDFVITILPFESGDLVSSKLEPIRMLLVEKAGEKKSYSIDELKDKPFVRIQGAKKLLGLSTEGVSFESEILLNDFYTKKGAIVSGLGFGWLPEYLVKSELASGELSIVESELEPTHILQPRLYHRRVEQMGQAATAIVNEISIS